MRRSRVACMVLIACLATLYVVSVVDGVAPALPPPPLRQQ
jgi:hypothetical protein